MSGEIIGFANAKSYRDFMESAQNVAKQHDRRRSSVLQNITISKHLFSEFLKEQRADSIIEEEEQESSSSDDAEDSSTINTFKKSKLVDEDNVIVDLKAPHLAQQQQRPSQNGYGQNLEMTLTPLYDIDLYLHFDKKKRKIRKKLYPYLTRLQNVRNEKEYIRVRPILHNAGYANNTLWSKRSIQLEQTLRSYLVHNNSSNRASSSSLTSSSTVLPTGNFMQFIHENVSLYNKLPVEYNLAIVDTFWSDDESNPQLELIHRITSSDGTAITQERSLHKEIYRQLEFDLLLLNMVNDFMSLYKQIHSSAGLEQFIIENNILHDNSHLIKVLKKKNEVAEIFNEIYQKHFTSNKDEKAQESPQLNADGNYKCEGMLIAIAASNDVHIRPLCTSADMSLAMNELQDPRVFKEGYIAMPHMLQMNLERFTDGFYRFEYHAKEGASIKYLRICVPTPHKDLKPFLGMASYTLTSECFEEELLFASQKEVSNRKGVSLKYKSASSKVSKALTDGSLVPIQLLNFCNHLIRIINDIYRKFTKDYQKSSILDPPHKQYREADSDIIQYRILAMHHIEVRECLTHFRRNAVCMIDGVQRNFLKSFYMEFRKEWNTILTKNHTIQNIEDFYGLSAAQRSAIKYAHEVYKRLKENDETDIEVFELDLGDCESEFLKELKYDDSPSSIREKTHMKSKALIDQYRPDDKTVIVPGNDNNPDIFATANINQTVINGGGTLVGPSPTSKPGESASTSLSASRRPSKFDRKQSTFRSFKKKRTVPGAKMKSNGSDFDLSMSHLEEIDPFEKEREHAAVQYAENFQDMIKSGDRHALMTGYDPSATRNLTTFIDPFRGKLNVLCDSNSSKAYHRSFPASKELLYPDEIFPRPQRESPFKDSFPQVEKIHLNLEMDENVQMHDGYTYNIANQHHKSRREEFIPFPYVEKLNREAYRLAEKLDVLTVMMLGEKSISEPEQIEMKHTSSVDLSIGNDQMKNSSAIASPPHHSPQITHVRRFSQDTTLNRNLEFEHGPSFQVKSGAISFQRGPTSITIDDNNSHTDANSQDDEKRAVVSPLRAYLRRFSQRFKGLIEENIAYSDTESDTDEFPHDSDSQNDEPRELGLTKQEKSEEETKILETILTSIDPAVSERIRKGLALREERLRLIRRQQYIRRRRRQEKLSEENIKQLKEFYDCLPPNEFPLSSSSDEEECDKSTLDSARGYDVPQEQPPTTATFKRTRGNTIRKTTPLSVKIPTSFNIQLEHRSTNVTIDPSFYQRLGSRQSIVGSSGLVTPMNSRPNTTRPSMMLGNVTIDGLDLKKDSSKPSIWEQMTDTLSSMCDDVDNEAASFTHFQHQHRERRMGMAMLVQRSGGKLWGDSFPPTILVARRDNVEFTIPEQSSSSSCGGSSINSSDLEHKTPASSAVLLQISQFAMEYCCELFAVALASTTIQLMNCDKKDTVKTHRSVVRELRTSVRGSIGIISSRTSDVNMSSPIENFSRKKTFNLVNEFNKIFDEPLKVRSDQSSVNAFSNLTKTNLVPFTDILDEEDDIHVQNDWFDAGQIGCTNDDSENEELKNLLEVIKNNKNKKIDPLRYNGSITTPCGSHDSKRPYSSTLPSNSAAESQQCAFEKFMSGLKPKSSHAARMEYDEHIKAKQRRKPIEPIQAPQSVIISKVHSIDGDSKPCKLGIKGHKALNLPLSFELSRYDQNHTCATINKEDVPESDDEKLLPALSFSVSKISSEIGVDEYKNRQFLHASQVGGHPLSTQAWSLEGHSYVISNHQCNSTGHESGPHYQHQVTGSNDPASNSAAKSNSTSEFQFPGLLGLAVNAPTNSVISFPLELHVNSLLNDKAADDRGQYSYMEQNHSMSSLQMVGRPYPDDTEVRLPDISYKDGDRVLVTNSVTPNHETGANLAVRSEKYFASSILQSINNAHQYHRQLDSQLEVVRSPTPSTKKSPKLSSPPCKSLRPSSFSPNRRNRMLKSPHLNVDRNLDIADIDGVLQTSRPVTTATKLLQSEYCN